MGSLNYRRIFTLVGVFSLIVYYSIYWVRLLGDPNERTGSDFMGVYVFGKIIQTKGYQSLYDISEHQAVEEQVLGHPVTPIFYTHLPFMAPIASIIVVDDYIASFERWAIVLLFLNALSVTLLVCTLDIKRYTRENLLILVLGAFFFDPTASGFMNGQDTAFLLLGTAICLAGLHTRKYFITGLGLSLTTVRPQAALLLAIPFFFRYRKVFWGFILGSFVLASISVLLLKVEGIIKFLESLRYIEGTIWVEPHSFDMPTISGIIRRNFVVTNPTIAKGFVWLCYVVGIAVFSLWWQRSKEISESHFGLLSIFAIFLLPYAHYHELTLLLIPIFCSMKILENLAIDQYYIAILPLGVSWLSALGFVGSGIIKFSIVYIIMIVLGYLLLRPEHFVNTISKLSSLHRKQ